MLRTSLVLLSLTLSSLIRHQRFSFRFCFRLNRAMSASVGPDGLIGKESGTVVVCPAVDAELSGLGVDIELSGLGADVELSGLGADLGALRLRADEMEVEDREERDDGEDLRDM
jgi:hypothetical protein